MMDLTCYRCCSQPCTCADGITLYHGDCRAKKACFLVGKQSTATMMCRRVALGKRKTFLKELICERV